MNGQNKLAEKLRSEYKVPDRRFTSKPINNSLTYFEKLIDVRLL